MKKTAITILLSLFAFSLFAQNKEYKIVGKAPQNDEGKYAYLRVNSSKAFADSALIKDGKFSFKGEVEMDQCAIIDIPQEMSPGGFFTPLNRNFVLEPGLIEIDFTSPSSINTPLNKAYQDYFTEIRATYQMAGEKKNRLRTEANLSREEQEKKIETIDKECAKAIEEVNFKHLKLNSNNSVGVYVITSNMSSVTRDNEELFHRLYDMAGPRVREYPSIKRNFNNYKQIKAVSAGSDFLDFHLADGNMDGTAISFSDYIGKGKFILVDFWASWCAPCKALLPRIHELYNQYKGDNFDIISIAVWDKRDKTIEAAKEHNVIWNQMYDEKGVSADLYGFDAIPHLIHFDPTGKVVARGIAGSDVRDVVEKALGIK